MRLDDIKLMFDYNYWANDLILAQAEKASAEQLMALNTSSYSSLHGTLLHTLEAEIVWRMLLDRGEFVEDLNAADFPDVAALNARWASEREAFRALIDSLDDDRMLSVVEYQAGEIKRRRIMWHCLLHVVNHGTQHRSEAAAMLTDFDLSPGDIDFTVFLNDRPA